MSLQLASLFQSHAVLQRDQLLPVWGWTIPHVRVRITLGPVACFAQSNASGDFLGRLPALPAGGPHTLEVVVESTGETWEATDILIGEVWVASGQSNMECTLAASRPLTEPDIAAADDSALRFFTVPRRADLGPQRTVDGEWKVSAAETAPDFSAVAYSFARRIRQELGVPVGIISSSWGGSFIQAWTSRSTLVRNPEIRDWFSAYEKEAWSETRWKRMAEIDLDGRVNNTPKDPGNEGITQDWHQPFFDDSDWDTLDLPNTWQSGGHPNSGVFWFRRQLQIPAAWIGRELTLELGAADKQDITYVNGVEAGRTGKNHEDQYWNVPRTYPIPASVVTGDVLTITVRVYSFVHDGGLIGPASLMKVGLADQTETPIPLAGVWRYRNEHDLGLVTEIHVMGHGERNSPHILFDNMILPLIPYAVRGAIWYQGEGNAGDAPLYRRFQQDLINDWRQQWGQPDFAFHLVQLPNFQNPSAHQPDSHWARLRETQTAALSLPGVGMAITIDLGEAGDIHPKNKIPVGERLAQSALAITYDRELPPYGPVAERFDYKETAIHCFFRHAGPTLSTTDGLPPRHFFLAGEDRIFLPALARIEGQLVIVEHPEISQPVAVRYAWADNPEGCNLSNRDGLPASPFRSDAWEISRPGLRKTEEAAG